MNRRIRYTMAVRSFAISLLASLCMVPSVGCKLEVDLEPATHPPEVAGVHAGAAKVDITPPAGFPMAGHAIDGGTSVGAWTRLHARAIYIVDEHGVPTAFVSADLWAMPAGLSDRVVELVQARGLTHVGREHVLIAATHTHHSPGNFSTARIYNANAGPSPGHDPKLFEFLADRIAGAIVEAAGQMQPAQLKLSRGRPPGLIQNRSPVPFAANPEACEIMAGNTDMPGCKDEKDRIDPCRAVYPVLTVLRIEHAGAGLDQAPIAIGAFYGTHPTIMTDKVDVYQADLFGIAAHHVERSLGAGGPEPVVAIFNGAEGDVRAQWVEHGRPETVRLGHRLGEEILTASGTGLMALDVDSTHRFDRTGLRDRCVYHAGEYDRTGKMPLPGASLVGGATDGRTNLYRDPPGKVVNRERFEGHGRKKPFVPIIFSLLFGGSVPREVPLSVHQLGPLRFVGVPGEFTTTVGVRIRERLAESNPDDVIVVGLADEYMSYFTTPEEYELQHYEGSSTMWGTHAGTVVVDDLGRMEHAHPHEAEHEHRVYRPGHHRHYRLRMGSRAHRMTENATARLACQLDVERAHEFTRWTARPEWGSGRTMPDVVLEREGSSGAWEPATRGGLGVIDHESEEFVTVVKKVKGRQWKWGVSWIGDPLPGRVRICVTDLAGADRRCSGVFDGSTVPAPISHCKPGCKRCEN